MVEYCKIILAKVSFDTTLLEKEFLKALNWMVDPGEKKEFLLHVEANYPQLKEVMPK